jgi:excisionase family DNA binding protein
MKSEYVTVEQAAQYLDTYHMTIRRYLHQGKLVGKKHPVNGHWRVDLESVHALALRIARAEPLPVLCFASESDYLASLQAEEPPAGEAGGLSGVTEYWFPGACPASD